VGPLPKKRHSHSRTHKRRAHDSLARKHLVRCETCSSYHVAHHVCPTCGSYNGQTVIEVNNSSN